MRTRIQTIVSALTGSPTFIYGTMSDFNFSADGETFPAVCMLPPLIQGTPSGQGAKDLNTYTIVLLFITNGGIGETTVSHATNVEAMLTLAKDFLINLRKDISAERNRESKVVDWFLHSLDPEDKTDFNQFFNAFDQQVDGYGMTVRVNLLEDTSECFV